MKMFSFLLGAALAVGLTASTMAADKSTQESKDKQGQVKKGKLRHVVAFKFKDTATKEQIKQVEDAFRDLKKKIPQIHDYEWGLNNSPEGLNKGFTHGFILTFNTEKDREIYLPHPDHKAFGKLLGPILADVFVIDFWAQE